MLRFWIITRIEQHADGERTFVENNLVWTDRKEAEKEFDRAYAATEIISYELVECISNKTVKAKRL